MIKVVYTSTTLEVSGHANYDKKGKDLVCAAVSAIVQTSASWFKKSELKIKRTKTSIKYVLKPTADNKAKLQLVVKQLKALEGKYKKHITISKEK